MLGNAYLGLEKAYRLFRRSTHSEFRPHRQIFAKLVSCCAQRLAAAALLGARARARGANRRESARAARARADHDLKAPRRAPPCLVVPSRPATALRAMQEALPAAIVAALQWCACTRARGANRSACGARESRAGGARHFSISPPPAAPQHPWNCPYHACAPHSPAHRTGVRVCIAAQTARASTPGAGRSVSGGVTARRAWLDEHINPPSRERRRLRTAFPPATRCAVHPPLRALPVCEIGRRRACGAHPVRADRGGRDASWRSGRGT